MRSSDEHRLFLLRHLRSIVCLADPAEIMEHDPGAYESATLEMARALFAGATTQGAIAVLEDEWGRTEGTSFSRRRVRRLRKLLTDIVPAFHQRGLTDHGE